MQLDWLTVVAQIVNFLTLIWLLKRFLYQPVLQAMDAREARIAQRLQEADERQARADQLRIEYDGKLQEFAEQRDALIDETRAEVEGSRAEWLERARTEINRQREQWQQALVAETEEMTQQLRRQISDRVSEVARRALADLAGAELEDQIVETFIKRLSRCPADSLEELAVNRITVATTFKPATAQRRRLREVLRGVLGKGHDVVFVIAPELLCGIELRGEGRKLAWTLADYLDQFELALETD